MRPDGFGPSDLLLNDGPPKVAARSSFGGADNVGAVDAIANVLELGATTSRILGTHL